MITHTQRLELEKVYASAERMLERIDKDNVSSQDSQTHFYGALEEVRSIFRSPAYDEGRIFDQWRYENGLMGSSAPYRLDVRAGEDEKANLNKILSFIGSFLPDIRVVPSKKEFHFSDLEGYKAKRLICSLIRSADSSVLFLDEHLDDQFFDYIDIIPENIQIRVLTGEGKPIFWNLLTEWKKKHSNIDARVNSLSHCRFLVIDDSRVFSTDASLNTIGKKAFMLHVLENGAEIAKVKNEIEQYWTAAKIR